MEQQILSFFLDYAYQPYVVYSFIILFMTASSFGLPMPEEIILLSAGLVTYMASQPDLYPPPYLGAKGVNVYVMASVCFFGVLGSDILIFLLGKKYGRKILFSRLFRSAKARERLKKIELIYQKYGFWGCGFFRFLPGIRFPGHLSCGIMGVKFWQFLLVDGSAALISVPSQVFLVAEYGEMIISKVKKFNMIVIGIVLTIIVFWVGKKLYHYLQERKTRKNVI